AVQRQRQERLAVGLLVERPTAVGGRKGLMLVERLDLGRDVEEALGAQEEAVALAPDVAGEPQGCVQLRLRAAGSEAEVLAPAFGVEAGRDGNRFQDGGLA